MSTVIVLNGVSSAGKTTIARALQATAGRDLLYVSMDGFLAMLPIGREMSLPWFIVDQSARDGHSVVSVRNGPEGEKLLASMRVMVADMANRGFDIVVDEVCTAIELAEYRLRLSEHVLHVVKVTAELTVIEQREKERGDRMLGLAREQATRLHEAITYDQTVDTTHQSPAACAKAILSSIG